MQILEFPPPAPGEWPQSTAEAIALQKQLAAQIILKNGFKTIRTIAGVDVSYDMKSNISRAAIVLMRYQGFDVLHTLMAHMPTIFPYVPGLLSFREIPVILAGLNALPEKPDLVMVDGQGIAHPRRLGIAAHLGLLTGLPALGVAKSRLTGTHGPLGPDKGDTQPLLDKGEVIGTVLRSKPNTNPLYISPGHRIDHKSALAVTLHCLQRHRLPEPTRIADKLSKAPPAAGGLL